MWGRGGVNTDNAVPTIHKVFIVWIRLFKKKEKKKLLIWLTWTLWKSILHKDGSSPFGWTKEIEIFFTFDEHNFDEDEHKASPIVNDYRVILFWRSYKLQNIATLISTALLEPMQNYSPLLSLPLVAHDTDVLKLSAYEVCSALFALNPRKASSPNGLLTGFSATLLFSSLIPFATYRLPLSSRNNHPWWRSPPA